LCYFTSTKNNDFIYTPIAPPAPEAKNLWDQTCFVESCYERAIYRCQFWWCCSSSQQFCWAMWDAKV
jgi:hypothetical protein